MAPTHAEEHNGAATEQAAENAPAAIDRLFKSLIQEAQQINSLLNEVSDKDSADRVAPELNKRLSLMDAEMKELEKFPFRGEQDSEALTMNMAALTHVTQICLEAMQRLSEINAYGSEALMSVFKHYKLQDNTLSYLKADDLPHTRLYNELADTLDDVLYSLRSVQDTATAEAAVRTLQPLLLKLESEHNMLVQLAPPRTDDQREAVRPARERLQRISAELKAQNDRLQAAHCYRCSELDLMLPRLLQVAAS